MTTVMEKSRVLVVDDEPQITRVLRTVLSSQGYQVHTAAEGESALTDFKSYWWLCARSFLGQGMQTEGTGCRSGIVEVTDA